MYRHLQPVLGRPRNTIEAGFTLVEMMIALLMAAIVMGAVASSFNTQHKTYLAQDQVVEMQENARVAMELLTRDIRSAGYDPSGLGAGITTANSNSIQFTRDDGTGTLETIQYSLVDAYASIGRNDGVVDDLGRDINGGGAQPVAENIRQLEFRYLDQNGNVTSTLADIRSVQIALMAQSAQQELKVTAPTRTYTTPSGTNWTPDANYWSFYLSTTVKCRNLGL